MQADLKLTMEQKLAIIAARDEYLKVLDLLQIRQVSHVLTQLSVCQPHALLLPAAASAQLSTC